MGALRRPRLLASRDRLAGLAFLLAAVCGCGPGGPSCHELAANPMFTTRPPDATAGGATCSDPRSGIEGSTYGFATQVLGTDETPDAVVAWYRAAFSAPGWSPTTDRPIFLADGYAPSDGWRNGDLVVGVGVLRRDSTGGDPTRGLAGSTVFEVVIAYDPPHAR